MDEEQLSHLISRWYNQPLPPQPTADCPTLTTLHELALCRPNEAEKSEPPSVALGRITEHVNSCSRCQRHLASIRRELAETALDRSTHSRRWLRWLAVPAAAAACLIVTVLFLRSPGERATSGSMGMSDGEILALIDRYCGELAPAETHPVQPGIWHALGALLVTPPNLDADERRRLLFTHSRLRQAWGRGLLVSDEQGHLIVRATTGKAQGRTDDPEELDSLVGLVMGITPWNPIRELHGWVDEANDSRNAFAAAVLSSTPELEIVAKERLLRVLDRWIVERVFDGSTRAERRE